MDTVAGQPAAFAPTAATAATGPTEVEREVADQTIPIPVVAPTTPARPTPAVGARRNGPWLVVAIVAVVVVLGLAGGLVFVVSSGHSPAHSTGSTSPKGSAHAAQTQSTPATSTTTTTTLPLQEQAAQAVASLLAQSVVDRSAINAASNDVSACGNLAQDQQTFDNAASSRQNLISQLSTLPNQSALPPSMIQYLNSAWQASQQVDQDYASWASDESSKGCSPNDTADPSYQAATQPNQQATLDKMAFASAWNPLATVYKLPTYQWNQL
jgi:uncharacterized membrane protein